MLEFYADENDLLKGGGVMINATGIRKRIFLCVASVRRLTFITTIARSIIIGA